MNPNLAKIDRTNEHYTFELAQGVKRTTVTFLNHFGIELAGDLYTPENAAPAGNSALAISGPFGAVKEQSCRVFCKVFEVRDFGRYQFPTWQLVGLCGVPPFGSIRPHCHCRAKPDNPIAAERLRRPYNP